jgi:hypothetical protein
MERTLSDALDSLRGALETSRRGECLSCDPTLELAPVADTLTQLGRLLAERGHVDFAPALRQMEQEVESWKALRCCADEERARASKAPDREEDARAALTEKCGAEFVDNRRGLRQVTRAPGAREGCFQSRACRKTEAYQGLAMQAGFWTYDGEYWYVWAERLTPQGEWVRCED